MQELGRFDTDLQMFVDAPREPDKNYLGYLVWLRIHGHFWDDCQEWNAVYPMPRNLAKDGN
jgi:hypothetical protein